MGVHGLWQLLNSTGKPVPLESLEGKVLAVDVSVWLHQLSKGMRDSSGNPVPNAHLHGLFTRICKLLYYRIKPVFVFDGGVPELKKQTLTSRRNQREEAERTSSLMQQKILTNLIRGQVLKEAYGLDKLPDVPPPAKSSARANREAIFELPPMPETSKQLLKMKSSEEEKYTERRELRKMVEENYEDISHIDVEAEEFKALPLEIQHEIIHDIRLGRKNYNLNRITELPEDSQDFSSFQMAKLLKRSKQNTRLDVLKKELNERQTKKLSLYYGKKFADYDEVVSQRVVSEDSAHYLLAKRNISKSKGEESKTPFEVPMETMNEKHDSLLVSDDMLLDSDDDVDVLEESKLIFNELSEQNDSGSSTTSAADNQTCGSSIRRSDNSSIIRNDNSSIIRSDNSSIIGSDNSSIIRSDNSSIIRSGDSSIMRSGDSSIMRSGNSSRKRRFDEEKPRFKAVIEIESDSDSDTTETVGRSSEMERLESDLAEVDFHEDHELQMAIELSLKDKRTFEGGTNNSVDTVVGDEMSKKKSIDVLDETNQLFKNSLKTDRSLGIPIVMGKGEGLNGIDEMERKKIQDQERSRISCKSTDKVRSGTMKHTAPNTGNSKLEDNNNPVNKSNVVRKTFSNKEENFSKRIEPRTVENIENNDRSKGSGRNKHSVFKRKISSVSNDSNESGEVSGEVKVINLSEDENISDNNIQEDSSSSEDDFIEVKVDLTKVDEDDLFPASMFEPVTEPLPKRPKLESRVGEKDRTVKVAPNIPDDFQGRAFEVSEEDVIKISNETDDENFQVAMATESDDNSSQKSEVNKVEAYSDEEEVNVVRGDSGTEEVNVVRSDSDTEEVNVVRGDSDTEDNLPQVTNLAQQFESVNEQRVKDLSTNLRQENRQLRLEQGRQERLAMSITDQMHSEAQELLQLFGIPFIVSPTEAEAQCAQLELSHLSHGTITDDSDIWLFGGKCVFKNFFNQQKHVECFKEENISTKLGLTREALINLALLCGSDYTEGIRGVGPVTAMEILAQFPGPGLDGLNKFKSWWEKAQKQIKLPIKRSKFLNKLKDLDVRSDFPSPHVVEAYLSPTVDDSGEKCSWSLPDLDLLRQFASQKLNWTREKTDEVLLPVMKRLADRQTQRGIMSYFQPEVYLQPAAVRSKRLQKVVNKLINPEAEITEEPELSDSKSGRGQKKKNDNETNDSEEHVEEAVNDKNKNGKRGQRKKNVHENNDKNGKGSEPAEKDIIEENKKGKRGRKKTNGNEKNDKQVETVTDKKKLNKGRKRKNSDNSEGDNPAKKLEVVRNNTGKRLKSDRTGCEGVCSSVKVTSDKINEDSRSSTDTESDSDSDLSDSDGDLKVVKTGLNIEEILGMKMGFELGEVDTVGSSLDVAEILNLKMGCKLDEITSGVESQKAGEERVYEHLVNVNEILHLDPGTGLNLELGTLPNLDSGTGPTVTGATHDKVMEHSKEEIDEQIKAYAGEGGFVKDDDATEENVDVELKQSKGGTERLNEAYAGEGGFVRDDDEDIDDNVDDASLCIKTSALIDSADILEQTEDSSKDCLDNNSIRRLDDVNVTENSKRTRSTRLKSASSERPNSSNSKLKASKQVVEDCVGNINDLCREKQLNVTNELINSKKTRSTNSKITCLESGRELSKIKDKGLLIQDESNDVAVGNGGASSSLNEVKQEPISQECKISMIQTRGVRSKKSAIKESVYATEPLRPVVTRLPWADKKKGKRKVQSGKSSGLKLVPKEIIVKTEKKPAAKTHIGCVNLSESDSDD